MNTAASEAIILLDAKSTVLATVDPELTQRLAREIESVNSFARVTVISSLERLQQVARSISGVIVLDCDLLGDIPLEDFLGGLAAPATAILIVSPQRQSEAARLVTEDGVEFVARTDDFVSVVAGLVERRLRWAERSLSLSSLAPPWAELADDIGTIFRHEINNPLTGILGNAELVLAHNERLSAVDTQRLQTVVELAVRLRETVRRLSNAWERRQPPDPTGSASRQPGSHILKSA